MRQLLQFYVSCCIGNILFHLVSAYFSSDIQDLRFGFPIAMIFVFFLYSPLCTFLAYMYKFLKINSQILKYPLLYSLSPFILAYLIVRISGISAVSRDYLLLILFVSENILIIGWFCYQRNHLDQGVDQGTV